MNRKVYDNSAAKYKEVRKITILFVPVALRENSISQSSAKLPALKTII